MCAPVFLMDDDGIACFACFACFRALPENAIYLAAYDIQWTAVVYMQKCEGYRSVDCLNSSCSPLASLVTPTSLVFGI